MITEKSVRLAFLVQYLYPNPIFKTEKTKYLWKPAKKR